MRRDGLDLDGPVVDVASEMVIFDGDVFCSRCELRTGGDFDAALIVLPNRAFENGLRSSKTQAIGGFL